MRANQPVEVEWQFDAPDLEAVVDIMRSGEVAGFGLRESGAEELRDTYFDTDDWRIHRGGYTARLRSSGDEQVLTLKRMGEPEDGVRVRREFEEPAPRSGLRHIADSPGPGGRLLRLIGPGGGYRELFGVRTQRRSFAVLDGDSSVAEVAIDRTECFAPGRTVAGRTLDRVEVEAARGLPAGRLAAFADALSARASLGPASESKFEAGLASADLAPPSGQRGPAVSAGMSAGEAARAIIRRQRAALILNEPGTRLGDDPEPLHDMRVAARRMRAAIQAFGDHLDPVFATHGRDARWVGAALGLVRDLDVQLEDIGDFRREAPAALEAGLLEVEALLESGRRRARRRMLRSLASPRFGLFLEGLASTLEEEPGEAGAGAPVLEAGPGLLASRYGEFRRLGDAIGPDSRPGDYHELRIAAKKLRYGLEFLAPVYGKPLKEYRSGVTDLQDLLGRHQDMDVAARTLERLAGKGRRALSPAAGEAVESLTAHHEREQVRLRRQFGSVYRQLQGAAWQRVLDACELRSAQRSG